MVDFRSVGEWNGSLEVERERLTKELKENHNNRAERL